jgi:hypothetical protein
VLVAAIGDNVTFASVADSPSAALNASIVAYARTNSQGVADWLICIARNNTGATCKASTVLIVAASHIWNRMVNEYNAAP